MKSATKTSDDAKTVKKSDGPGSRAKHRPKGQPNMADLESARKLPPFLIRSF